MATKLELVNHLLQVNGERGTPTLVSNHPSVKNAVQALDGYNSDFQGMGWWFNTNQQQKLTPDADGHILLPEECLSFRVTFYTAAYSGVISKSRYVTRGNKVYDSILNTNVFTGPITADIVLLLDIEDLPPTAAAYLKHKAAQEYYLDDDGDTAKVDRLGQRTTFAWHNLKAEQLKVENTNALDSPAAQALNYRIGSGYSRNPMWPGGRG